MTDPRDPQKQPPSHTTAASDTDLAASELLEDWLVASARGDDTHNHDTLTARAEAMLDARNVLRSRDDAASSGELERLLEGALEQLDGGLPPLLGGDTAGDRHAGQVRRLAARRPWVAAAAAAVVLIVGIGALAVQGSDLEESAQDAGVSSAATQPADAEDAEADAAAGVVTTMAVPEAPERSMSPEQRADESSSSESGEFAEPGGSAGSSEAADDALDTNEKVEPPGSIFAGVHATGRIRLR